MIGTTQFSRRRQAASFFRYRREGGIVRSFLASHVRRCGSDFGKARAGIAWTEGWLNRPDPAAAQ